MHLGIDLGGTKIEIIALDQTGRERYRRRAATPRGSYEGTLTVIADLVRAAERDAGTRGTVGVAMPGAMSPATGLRQNADSTRPNRGGRPARGEGWAAPFLFGAPRRPASSRTRTRRG